MKIAITGGTGFVGRHLARALTGAGHQVVVIARGKDKRDEALRAVAGVTFFEADLSDPAPLAEAFAGCDAIAHCAGINRETGMQTYKRIHVDGTAHVLEAMRRANIGRVLLLSFLRARPDCGSPYHESKWAAEELVRASGFDYTVFKAGMVYGRGDHMLDHLSHTIHTAPLFATVGLREQPIRPVAIEDAVDILIAALVRGRLSRQTVFILGPETLLLSDAVRRVAKALGRRMWIVPAPVWFHVAISRVFEATMRIPLIATAQVRMLAEGFQEAAPTAEALPADLTPQRRFTEDQIRRGLPDPGPFRLRDLRCCG
jgi:nucleoside-diphosphate-sugar epimerase